MIYPVLLLVASASVAIPPTSLEPSSKWQVEYAKSSCIISRAFGEGDQKTIFGLKPAPYSDWLTLLIIQPSAKGRGVRGNAEIKLSGGLVPDKPSYSSVVAKGVRVTTVSLQRSALPALAKGESISVKAGGFVNVALKPAGFDKVMKVLEDCESDLLTSWGFDKAAQAAVAERPKGNLQGLLRPDDYPQAAIDSNASGRVDFRLRIEADGRISDCFILQSSGSAILDKQTCALIVKRARYAPALGHDGKPIWTFTFATVTWMLM